MIVVHIDGMTICDYWESKTRFGNGSTQDVHWGAVGKTMESAGRALHHWVVKQASGFCATGKMMQRGISGKQPSVLDVQWQWRMSFMCGCVKVKGLISQGRVNSETWTMDDQTENITKHSNHL